MKIRIETNDLIGLLIMARVTHKAIYNKEMADRGDNGMPIDSVILATLDATIRFFLDDNIDFSVDPGTLADLLDGKLEEKINEFKKKLGGMK